MGVEGLGFGLGIKVDGLGFDFLGFGFGLTSGPRRFASGMLLAVYDRGKIKGFMFITTNISNCHYIGAISRFNDTRDYILLRLQHVPQHVGLIPAHKR